MSQVLERARRAVIREALTERAALRAAPRRTVVTEAAASLLVAAVALLPLLAVHPTRPVLAVLEGCWAALLVPVRHRRPVLAVLGTAPLLVGDNVWTMVAIPLIVLSATRNITPARRAWHSVLATCAGALTLALLIGLRTPRALPEEVGGTALSALLLLVLPALSGTLLGRRRPLVRLLRERNAYLEQARSLTAATARLEERARIAGEMHDLLGHRLSLISVHAGALELSAARHAPPLAGQAELLRTTAGSAMEELREILDVLRRAEVTEPSPKSDRGTREDIAALVAEARGAGVTVDLTWSGPDTADAGPRTRQAMHRVVREALTNVLKHAAGAPTRVDVHSADGRVEVSVTNEAPRTPVHPLVGNHSGLAGLDERVRLLGGSFTAGPAPTGGFRVAARLPCTPSGTTTPDATTTQFGTTTPVAAAAVDPAGDPAPPLSDPASPPTRAVSPSLGLTGVTDPTGAEAYAPLSAEALTWPRVLGAGCAAVCVGLPTVASLVVLLALAILR
ncbi:sensor histidine kinase [Streptomyces sp. NPDC087212]|uniref:sensor histidine kinase n=1 Tax=Streptomyces sp. NPDC087212 TaxID=3365766 RepID=UPI0038235FED